MVATSSAAAMEDSVPSEHPVSQCLLLEGDIGKPQSGRQDLNLRLPGPKPAWGPRRNHAERPDGRKAYRSRITTARPCEESRLLT